MTAVPITAGELRLGQGRTDWDRHLLYTSMIRWGQGHILPVEQQLAWRHLLGRTARGASRLGDASAAWRASKLRRRLRDIGQIEWVRAPEATAVLYGHIVLPVSRPRLPTVWSSNGVVERPGPNLTQSATTHARLMARADAVQIWTEHGRQGLLERAPGVDARRIHVIPPLIDIDLPDPWPRDDASPRALYVGAFGYLKGLRVVLDAAGRLPDLQFEVITAAPRPSDLPSNIDWLGPRPRAEVLARLQSCAVHVFPSKAESFGGVVMEALACGVAQVVDQNSVTAEVMGDGGVAVPGLDAAAVAEAVDRLAADDQQRRRLAMQGRRRYEAVYSTEVVGPQLERLIDSVA